MAQEKEVRIRRQSQLVTNPIKRALWEKDPRCHWCGVVTHWNGPGLNKSPDLATLDHLKPRWQCESKQEYVASTNHVLACQECNNLRDQIDQKMDPNMGRQKQLERFRQLADARDLYDRFSRPLVNWA